MPKLKEKPAPVDENALLRKGSNTQGRLLSFVERIERLEEEKAGLADDIKEVKGEAKGEGYDTVILAKVIARRKMDPASRQEADAILDLYETALKEAEKNQVVMSEAAGDGPLESPTAPLRRGWGAPKPAVTEPDDDEVQATAAAAIGHAADHPEE